MTPQCPTMQDDLKAYHDHELPWLRRIAVTRHLAHCAGCREEMKIMEQIGQQLQANEPSTKETTLNPALREKILTALPDNESQATYVPRSQWSPERPPLQNFLFQSGIVVASVLLFVVATTMFTGKRISNTFNGASNAMSGGGVAYDSESRPAISAAAQAPMAKVQSDSSFREQEAATRHLDGANYSFADGDVKWQKGNAKDTTITLRSKLQQAPGAASDQEAQSVAKRYAGSAATSNLPSTLRRVHKEARIAVGVTELEEKSNAVSTLIKNSDGFIANNTMLTGADGLKSATLTLRVPVARFETVLAEIGKLGEVTSKNVSGEDITEQFSDARQADIVVGSELSVKESILKAAMLKAEKAEKEGKPFATNWQLRTEVRRLRIEAAQVRARLELLKKVSDLSNIEVVLQEKRRTATEGGFAQQLSDASRSATESFLQAARLPILLLIWILAYSPLWLPVLLIVRYATRAYQRRSTHVGP